MHFASGLSFYSGLLLVLVILAAAPWGGHRWLTMLRNLLAVVVMLLVLLSATPVPWVLEGLFYTAWTAWLVAENSAHFRHRVAYARVGLALSAGCLLAVEFPHVLMPTLRPMPVAQMIVIGDSISVGLGHNITPWPQVFADKYNIPVTNLAMVGATTVDALKEADRVTAGPAFIVVEIGGNDVLLGSSVEQYAAGLDSLLAKLCNPAHNVIMLELPLPPFYGEFGRAQRRLAAKYHVPMIPKRCFAAVLARPGACDDGLHLSAAGADGFADMIYRAVGDVLPPHAITQHSL